MARKYRYRVKAGAATVEVTSAHVSMSAGDGASGSIQLLTPVGTTPEESGAWSLECGYNTTTGAGAEHIEWVPLILQGHVAAGGVRLDRNDPRRSESLTILDALSAFREIAPSGDRITHRATDLRTELAYVAGRLGAHGAETNIDRVRIPRIDYTRDASYISVVSAYYDLFEPWVFLDAARYTLRVIDPFLIRGDGIVLTPDDAKVAEPKVDTHAIVNQVKLSRTPGAGDSDESERAPVGHVQRRQTDPEETIDADGNKTVAWDLFDDLHEDLTDTARVTRSVPRGSVQETYLAQGDALTLVHKQTTEMHYAGDLVRLLKSTLTIDGMVDLPVEGRRFRPDVDRHEETVTYQPDPDTPRRKIRKTRTVEKFGIVIYSGDTPAAYLSIFDATYGVPPVLDAVQAHVATLNGAVDTRVDSSQSYRENTRISTLTERYTPSGTDQVTVSSIETNWLRGVPETSSHRTQIARNSVASDEQPIVEYRPVVFSSAFAPRPALAMDASNVGIDWGRSLADRKLRLAGAERKTVRIELLYVNPHLKVCDPVTLANFGFLIDGRYIIEGIEINFDAGRAGSAPRASQIITATTL